MTHDDELGDVMAGYDYTTEGKPFDPAAWEDWRKSIQKITKRDQITAEETHQAMLLFIKKYNDHQGFNLKKVIKFLDKAVNVR